MLLYVCVESEFETERVRRYRVGEIGFEREETRPVCVCAFVPFSWQANVGLSSVRVGSCTFQASAHAHSQTYSLAHSHTDKNTTCAHSPTNTHCVLK